MKRGGEPPFVYSVFLDIIWCSYFLNGLSDVGHKRSGITWGKTSVAGHVIFSSLPLRIHVLEKLEFPTDSKLVCEIRDEQGQNTIALCA